MRQPDPLNPRRGSRMIPGYIIVMVVCISMVVVQIVVLQMMMEQVDKRDDVSAFWDQMEQNAGDDHDDGLYKSQLVRNSEVENIEEKWDFSIMDILSKANVDLANVTLSAIPNEAEVVGLYGPKPVIVGLDRCEDFRSSVPPVSRMIAPAGMFNTGTNLMTQLLERNCYIPERVEKLGKQSPGMRRQVPWGKHSPASWRFKHKAAEAGDLKHQEYVLPAVVIKDPYTWMTSMCRHSYNANWIHVSDHCPNLIANEDDVKKFSKIISVGDIVPVNVRYNNENITHHKSLANLWNDYYLEWYIEAKFPRLIVRFEDLLFRAEHVIGKVCSCAGGKIKDSFEYLAETAKKGDVHAGAHGLVASMSRYGNATLRTLPYKPPDLQYAANNLSGDLMLQFSYV